MDSLTATFMLTAALALVFVVLGLLTGLIEHLLTLFRENK